MPEYATGRGRVDYALRCPPHRPAAFIEVKGVGRSTDADRQRFEYAFHEGVQLAVLTDEREWNVHLPAQQGSYAERRAYQLVLDERDVGESEERLTRYLQRDRVASGAPLEAAIRDDRDARSKREAADTLPRAWAELLAEPDPTLLDTLLVRTEALCGFRPADAQAVRFLQEQAPSDAAVPLRARRPEVRVGRVQAAAPVVVDESSRELVRQPVVSLPHHRRRWMVGSQTGSAHKGIDAFVAFLDAIVARHPSQMSDMIAAVKTRSHNNITAELEDIDPRQPELAVRAHRVLASGLPVETNLSNPDKVQMARQVAHDAGLAFGIDAVLELAG